MVKENARQVKSSPKKRVLILTADAGFGHRSAAIAIQAALEEQYRGQVTVDVVNALDETTSPAFLRDSQSDYDRWVRNVPELYQLGYQASLTTTRLLLDRYKPHVVVTTYPAYQTPMLTAIRRHKRSRIPFFTVVTDLSTIHRLWFDRRVTGCLVPNSLVADLATTYGVDTSKVTITGIPVSPAISHESRARNKIRKELGWLPDIPTVLAVGSKRVDRLMDTLNVINHFGCDLQLAVVAGNDEVVYNELSRVDWHIPAYIYNFVENMPTLLKASDLLVCKAGGLILTEALASGLPMMLIEVIPGQETGNAEFVTAYGAADIAQSPIEVLETLRHLMKDDQSLLKKRAANAALMGKPRSAFDTAHILWNAMETKPRIKKSTLAATDLPKEG